MSSGANVKAVQRMLGHASAAMTLDIYADLFDADLDSLAARLDETRAAAKDQIRTSGHNVYRISREDYAVGQQFRGL